MASKVDIFNLALSNIGHKARLADPDQTSAEADACRQFYPIALAATLERYAWGFATRREQLAEVDNPGLTPWVFAYAMPNLCAAPRVVHLPGASDTDAQDFEVESIDGATIIYTDVEDAVLKYTALVEDTSKFSPMFVVALSYDLAHFLVGPIVKDDRKKRTMTEQAEYWTSRAAASDANNSQSDHYKDFIPSHMACRG